MIFFTSSCLLSGNVAIVISRSNDSPAVDSRALEGVKVVAVVSAEAKGVDDTAATEWLPAWDTLTSITAQCRMMEQNLDKLSPLDEVNPRDWQHAISTEKTFNVYRAFALALKALNCVFFSLRPVEKERGREGETNRCNGSTINS